MMLPTTLPLSPDGAIALFSEGLRLWFSRRFPKGPTAGQRLAWPAIHRGEHTLLSAPTGNGKTLAALMPVWHRLLEDDDPGLRCLYLAPLKALCNDLHQRIQRDLDELKYYIGPSAWKLTASLRTGDSKQSEKKRHWTRPPHLLVTTPESLSLMLAHPDAAATLGGVRWVIVDEVHALAANKRGADLAISLERLADLTPVEPQRIGLSATCVPLLCIGGWLGGTRRSVTTLSVPDRTGWDLDIVDLTEQSHDGSFLSTLLDHLERLMQTNGTLIVFTNVRSLSERIAWSLRRRLPHLADQIAVHHGSLARSSRHEVETDLQAGRLRIVLTSTSLELGIDIGHIDHVAFVHAPGGAARLLQRLGRGGHTPDGRRSGTLFIGSGTELLEAVVTKAASEDGCLEPLKIPEAPLDVLCQQLVALAVGSGCTLRHAWNTITRSYPYRHLALADFIRCVEFLTGGSKQIEVPARLRVHEGRLLPANLITPRLYRTNAGTIQEEPQRFVRLHEDQRVLGVVPDHFADRLLAGDRFLLNGRVYELLQQERFNLLVQEAAGLPNFTRWRGGMWNMPPALAERIWRLRVRLGEAVLDGDAPATAMLTQDYRVPAGVAELLIATTRLQQQVSEVPDTGLLVEATALPDGEHCYYAFHIPLPPSAADGLARVLSWRLRQAYTFPIEPAALGFLITLPAEVELTPDLLRTLLDPSDYLLDLRRATASSPVLARRFMESAQTGLMLLKTPIRGKQRKVGGSGWGGEKLLHWLRFADRSFPLLQQALKETCEDFYQCGATIAWLEQLQQQDIRLRCLPEPSPYASEWLPGSISTESTASDLDELLLSLRQQEATHAAS
jgi:ATP-dependent helicase Lhr and Lhr-like helicase